MESRTKGEYAERRASERLRAQVVMYRGHRTAGRGPGRLTLPAATVTLILGWGDPLHLFHEARSAPAERTAWHAMLAGLRTSSVSGGYTGVAESVEVEFTPLGAYQCLGMPLHHLTNTHLHPDEVLGAGWSARLTEQLMAMPDWESRWAVIDNAWRGGWWTRHCPRQSLPRCGAGCALATDRYPPKNWPLPRAAAVGGSRCSSASRSDCRREPPAGYCGFNGRSPYRLVPAGRWLTGRLCVATTTRHT